MGLRPTAITRAEHAALRAAGAPVGLRLDVSTGGGAVWLLDRPGNRWAVLALWVMRGRALPPARLAEYEALPDWVRASVALHSNAR